MSTVQTHTKLITAAARAQLVPLGLRQRGRSRIWLDDQGWWLGVVEFQPSSWSRGTYLNVGAMWLWEPIDHIAFWLGGRVGDVGFHEFRDDASFAAGVASVVARAAQEALRYREMIPDVRGAARLLAPELRGGGARQYHAAVAQGLAGERALAASALRAVGAPSKDDPVWMADLRRHAGQLAELASNPSRFDAAINDTIQSTRTALRLPPLKAPWS